MKMKIPLFRIIIAAAATTGVVVGFAPSAAAAPVSVNFDCQAKTPTGNQPVTQKLDLDVAAPATVAPNTNFDVVTTSQPIVIPTESSGYTLKEIDNFVLKIPVPAKATYVGTDLTGGSGYGHTPPKVTVTDGIASVTLAGPMKGGSTVVPPTITVHLTSATSGTITSTLYGTSYTDPGLTFDAVASTILGDITAPTSCFPNPNPTLSTTTIG
jgi:dehydratase